MTHGRIGGSTCGSDSSRSLDDGTLMRWLAPVPRPLSLLRPSAARRLDNRPDITSLFNSSGAPTRGLSDAAFAAAAAQLNVEVAAIRAVAEVESPGEAFDDQGRPRILFERHYFHRLTGGRFARSDPDLSNPTWGGYGKFRAQYPKLQRAYRLDPDAALQSASWGRFQIMGEHYARLGYASPQHMVQAFSRSEDEHLRAFVRFVQTDSVLLRALQRRDWAAFARTYNGKGYRKNAYDEHLRQAYERLTPARPPPPHPAAPATPPVQPPVPLGPRG